MKAGPFAIDEDNDSVIHPKADAAVIAIGRRRTFVGVAVELPPQHRNDTLGWQLNCRPNFA